jgi:hypothetical protein
MWVQTVYVEANSKEEAIDKVAEDDGCETGEEEYDFEYSHTLDKEAWDVEDDEDELISERTLEAMDNVMENLALGNVGPVINEDKEE